MQAELIAVGTELLLGDAVDTNSAWIAQRLAEIGVDVYRHTTVGDNPERLAAVLTEAAGRADALIVTGGLGPTQDDLTREAVARAAGVGLQRRPELVEHLRTRFAQRGRPMPENNLVQADLPAGARVLEPVGTAAGFALELPVRGHPVVCYCLPGVPREMQVMVERDVVADLIERGGLSATVSRMVRTAGMSESAVAEVLAPVVERLEGAGNPTVAFLATRGETRVRITAKAGSREAALGLVDPVVDEVRALLGRSVVGLDEEGAEHAVGRLLGAHGWRLAVAESVTGGGVGARLVTVPGASDWFAGGLVVYATESKTRLAGVDPELLRAHGPVSAAVAGALALGAARRLETVVGLGVVGVAGPEPQGGQPVGTVCTGVVVGGDQPHTRRVTVPALQRPEVLEWAVALALDHLRRDLAARSA